MLSSGSHSAPPGRRGQGHGINWPDRGESEETRCLSGQAPDDSVMALHLYGPRLQLDETLEQMQQGTLMRKVKSKSWKKQRYFRLQDDCMTVWYKSKKTGYTKYTFSISDVETVREGHQSEVLQSLAEEFPPEHCFTVVFHGRRGNLDLIAGSPEEAQCWVRGLRRLVEIVTKMDQQEKMDQYPSASLAPSPFFPCLLGALSPTQRSKARGHGWGTPPSAWGTGLAALCPLGVSSSVDGEGPLGQGCAMCSCLGGIGNCPPGRWICDWFQKADKNKDGRMSFKEVRQLLKMMNMDMNEDHALRLFQMADRSESGTLEGEEFVLFYKALTQRDDVLDVFQVFSQDGKKLTLLEFVDFLQQEQLEGENTQEFAMELIARYEPSETARARHMLSVDGFLLYLLSPEGAIFNPAHGPLCQDMTQPLCHYFISSSHNTYLLEDQLRGQSSVEGYIRALKRGCRCLEVDCWDGPSGEPVVYHGHTFTSKIPFKDVVTTLGQYAFQTSDYPVILSLENHCGPEQQDLLAQHLKGILGERLELRGRIILKGKRAESLAHSPNGQPDKAPEGEASEDDDEPEAEEDSLSQEAKRKAKADRGPVGEGPVRLGGHRLLLPPGNEFVRHNAWQLTRIYPSGLRTDSSNYDPQEMWNVGCQLVALNVQTAGAEMDLCDGLFRQNARCGYVLKPAFLRDAGTAFDPDNPRSRAGGGPWSLAIQVISGQQLPKVASSKASAIVDPLVRVEIHGVPADQARRETQYVDNNGFNPSWGETLQFKVHVPELALVRFVVEDYDKTSRNDFVGQFTLPFASIKSGYRHVHLLSKDGTAIPPSSLFVHIQITELPYPE
ncbi:1-phosphatidylinositol-4,5-bisphosphate phosphodiesterase delta-4 [Chelonia mydas]|uniref:Phosphoinositide phospholipase C n=1 Tax=Chelonia mydas TaxID=8469 RepID=M7BDC9_CHEMY|nr:1-phosphatidylinositol-4,5-bisphosphate phosphodiesterase delta-4 [Chelonia mydas]